MIIYRRLHEIVLIILIIGMLNLYDIVKNVEISVYEVININEKNLIYLLLITLFFFFIFFHYNILDNESYGLEFELILGLGLIGLSFLILSNDLILFFLALELYSLSVYLLLFKNEINKAKISILYFLLGSISSSFILLAFSILYSYTGCLDLNYIIENIGVIIRYHKGDEIIIIMGFALFLLGLLFKLGSAPFQFWVIRVYTQMDLKVLIYQSIIPKIAYIYIISKILNNFNPTDFISYLLLFLLLFSALLSLFVGPLGGLTHGVNQFKTIIAYSSILHVGYLLLGLVSNFFNENIPLGLDLFQYLFIYAFNTFHFLLAFFFLQSLYNKRSINYSILLLNFLISIFSFIGLPPFAGFYAKLNIIINCYYTNTLLLQLFGIIFIFVSTLIALFLYLKFINYLYFTKLNPNLLGCYDFYNVESDNKDSLLFSYLLSFLSLFLLFYPFFLPFLSPIFEIL